MQLLRATIVSSKEHQKTESLRRLLKALTKKNKASQSRSLLNQRDIGSEIKSEMSENDRLENSMAMHKIKRIGDPDHSFHMLYIPRWSLDPWRSLLVLF